jgi:EAL domain-containing protein (putative c-di-GMP-specific phosphodiesterase class I)
MRARGAQVALDDVGAGGEDLQRLVTLQPDIVKIDRSLVAGIDVDTVRGALVGALVAFAREVGAVICAEGVETRPELTVLQGMGVDLAQGFLWAAAVGLAAARLVGGRSLPVGAVAS